MSFMLRKGWFCQFLEPDLQTALPRKLSFADVEKVRELAKRGGGVPDLERYGLGTFLKGNRNSA